MEKEKIENNKTEDSGITCPYCQSDKVKKYHHGNQQFNNESEYLSGGNEPGDENPGYHCDNCGRDFGESAG
jgi:DNA-directed RNA polymerase subunit RPC12/RpoP